MKRLPRLALALLLSLSSLALARAEGAETPAEIDFQRDVRPIFEEHCYRCHGSIERKGGLRLTNRRDAFQPGDLGIPVIEPGNADLSPLYELVTSTDPDERMPKKKDPLPPEKIERIRRWIEAGAPWPTEADRVEPHWAYRTPKRPAPPAVGDPSWPRNEIDRFVLARLEAESLRPAPEADRRTLARRLHFDLTGLPPTPDEIDAFLADESPDAYERLVDRLLASPAFGEKWARPWLDAARYADSTGFQTDQITPNWPYRDWVIDAINADMPYDEFTIEQLAGDLLPNPTIAQRVATGFNRSAPLNLEVGIHREESRVGQVMDRVNTTSTIWLGSTIECAQCHDHKFDPFRQEEYYRLLAFFNNTPDESRPLSEVAYRPAGPTVDVPLPEDLHGKRDALLQRLQALLEREGALPASAQNARAHFADLASRGDTPGAVAFARGLLLAQVARQLPSGAYEAWVEEMRAALFRGEPQWRALRPLYFDGSGGEGVRLLPDGSLLVDGAVPDTSTYVVKVRTNLGGITAFQLEAFRDESLPGKGPGRGDVESPDFVVSEIEIRREVAESEKGEENEESEARPIGIYRAVASYDSAQGRVDGAIDGKPETGWSIADGYALQLQAAFLVDEPIAVDGPTTFVFTIRQNAGFGKTIGRFRLSATNAPADVVAAKFSARALRDPKPDEKLAQHLRTEFLSSKVDGKIKSELGALARDLEALRMPTASVMEELAEPRDTHLMKRGNYLDPGAKVTPDTPAVLPPMSPDLPRNRLGLARWLVDPENPLVGRVTVNQWWQEVFGRGLVATPEDFGSQGDRPSHPELLDWLAVELVESGWSRKRMLREIVTSATYRQSSQPATSETLERDPESVLLTRNPRLRLPAELVRDNALAIAGLLSRKRGGPAVYPPQPDGLWKLTGTLQPTYVASHGDDRYRRGIYTIWRRSSPYPSFVAFDAKDRTACVLRRSRTNTPLQALTLLNDEVYVEAALRLAERILAERPEASVPERTRHGFRLALGREPTDRELAAVAELLAVQQGRLRERDGMADELLGGVSSFAPAAGVDRDQLAAWYFVASALLNLDETITRG